MNSDRIYLGVVPLLRPLVRPLARRRRAQFEAAPLARGRVVFLGDSITEGGFWDAWFPELPTLNRGIGGDTTEDILDRLESAIHDPAAVSLLIGTNDLHGPRRLRDPDGIAARLREILRRIQASAPGTPVLLNSVLPRTAWFAPRLQALNERYRRMATELDVRYVDLWPALADGDALRKELTQDNLHLTPAGYRAWSDVLRPHLIDYASR